MAARAVTRMVRKRPGACLEYHEFWLRDGVLVVHAGEVGDRGETRKVPAPAGVADRLLEAEAEAARLAGFRAVREEDFVDVVVQFPLEEGASPTEQLEVRNMLEEQVSQSLGWGGVGYCTGGDIGGGVMNIWCRALDASCAVGCVVTDLEDFGLDDGLVMAKRVGDGFLVLYPWGAHKPDFHL